MRHIRIVDPVVKCIHVLDGGMLAAKLPVARFAFVVVVHVGLCIVLLNRGTRLVNEQLYGLPLG